jgi:4,5:9,10-diseco-3-hydroxy-5,9,17-trioxoandrosta-1(10),2-diene-4-oate hydrolase
MGLARFEVGSGPPLLLLHGAGPGVTGASNFRGNLDAFGAHHRTIVVDLPGFGTSPCPSLDRPYPEVAAEAVADLLDELGTSGVHVLGNSMGAFVAVELAVTRPDLVDRLVLMGFGGAGINVLGPTPSEGGRRSREFVADPRRETLVAWLESMVFDPDTITPELLDERMEAAMREGAVEHMAAVRASMSRPLPEGRAPRWATIDEVPCPTLLVWGRDDRMVPWEHALLPLRRIHDVELHVFARCGHWAQVERKTDFERVVLDFLARSDPNEV